MPLRRFRQCLDGIQISSILIFSCLAARSHTRYYQEYSIVFFRLCSIGPFCVAAFPVFLAKLLFFHLREREKNNKEF